jgi:hypothetical protein
MREYQAFGVISFILRLSTIDFQIINFTRPEGRDNTSSISLTDNAVKLFIWKSIMDTAGLSGQSGLGGRSVIKTTNKHRCREGLLCRKHALSCPLSPLRPLCPHNTYTSLITTSSKPLCAHLILASSFLPEK